MIWFTPQIFMSQLSVAEYGKIQEQLYKFRGVYAQQRVLHKYTTPSWSSCNWLCREMQISNK